MSEVGDRRLKVCFVLPSLAGGGAERAAVLILNALDDERWERWMYLFASELAWPSAWVARTSCTT